MMQAIQFSRPLMVDTSLQDGQGRSVQGFQQFVKVKIIGKVVKCIKNC